MVARRGDQARDDQLPHVQAGTRRPVLRQDLRADHRLGVPVRQVQAHEAPRRDLRQVRRRSDAGEGPPRAAGPHHAGHAGQPRVVLQGAAEPHRPPPRHLAARSRARPLLRGLRRRRSRRDRAEAEPAAERRGLPQGARRAPAPLQGADGRRGDQGAAEARQRRSARDRAAREDEDGDLGAEEAEVRQAPEGRRLVPEVEQPAGVDDPRRHPGDSAGTASAGAARRRPLRDLGPERPLSPRHQPQQPVEEADGAEGAGRHHPQRKAHAAGSGRRAVRQRPPRPRAARRQQPAAQVAVRHAQGQAGTLPPEPARQARRLLRPFGHRRRPRAEAAPVRAAEEDGARAVQAVHLQQARRARARRHDQAGEGDGRAPASRSVGRARGSHPRASGAAEPRADAASPRHPGVRAGAGRRQGDPHPSARLHGVQRRLRRRPDGGPHPAVARSADRGVGADALEQQHPVARARRADRDSVAGHRARLLLPHEGEVGRQGRRTRVRQSRRRDAGARGGRARDAVADPAALHRRAPGSDRRARRSGRAAHRSAGR